MTASPDTSWAYRVPGLDMDTVSDALTVAGITPAGLSEEQGVTTAWFASQPAQPMPVEGVWETVARADWAEAWKVGITPVTVGHITVSPPWLAPDGPRLDPSHPIVLVIEPGMAFGTGHHETTTACLAALQELDLADRHVVDIGTGTGVLALAARALGARSVVAVDTDPEAVAVAQANVAAHPLDGIDVRLGSCAQAGAGDVVVANIITDKLLAIADELCELVSAGGTLIASGIADGRLPEAAAVFAAAGMPDLARRPGREWGLLIGHRPAEERTAPSEGRNRREGSEPREESSRGSE